MVVRSVEPGWRSFRRPSELAREQRVTIAPLYVFGAQWRCAYRPPVVSSGYRASGWWGRPQLCSTASLGSVLPVSGQSDFHGRRVACDSSRSRLVHALFSC